MGAIEGYKGFDKNLRCRDFQYEIGETYEEKDAVVCEKGFHFCEDPFDVFSYYPPSDCSRYCEVESPESAKTEKENNKIVS